MKLQNIPEYLNMLDDDGIHYFFQIKENKILELNIDDWEKIIPIINFSKLHLWELELTDWKIWNGREDLYDFLVEFCTLRQKRKSPEVQTDSNRYLLILRSDKETMIKSFSYKKWVPQNKDLRKFKRRPAVTLKRMKQYLFLEDARKTNSGRNKK